MTEEHFQLNWPLLSMSMFNYKLANGCLHLNINQWSIDRKAKYLISNVQYLWHAHTAHFNIYQKPSQKRTAQFLLLEDVIMNSFSHSTLCVLVTDEKMYEKHI